MTDLPTILLVEDNPSEADLTRRAFAKNNVPAPLLVARDGHEALEILIGEDSTASQEEKPLPSLVLLDLNLPKVDGLEVLRRIRAHQRTRHIPVIVLSSSKEARDVSSAYELGANSYIRKPVDYLEFSEMIGQIGHYWLSLNVPGDARG